MKKSALNFSAYPVDMNSIFAENNILNLRSFRGRALQPAIVVGQNGNSVGQHVKYAPNRGAEALQCTNLLPNIVSTDIPHA